MTRNRPDAPPVRADGGTVDLAGLRRGRLSPWMRWGIVALAVALALGATWLTGGRWTWLLAGIVGVTALLALVPGVSWLLRPVGAYAGLWVVFNLLRAGADDTAWADRTLAAVPRLERWLAGGRLPSAALQDWLHDPGDLAWYDGALTTVYVSFFLVPHLVALLLLWRQRRLFWRYTGAMAVLFALATAGFYLLPTSPPWLVAGIAPDAGFAEIRRITEPVLAQVDLPFALFAEGTHKGVRTSEVRFEPNPVAAMPSIHFAATSLLIFPARRAGPVLGGVAVAYAAAMGFALVYLGEHYVLDLIAGGLATWFGWWLAGRWLAPDDAHGRGKTA